MFSVFIPKFRILIFEVVGIEKSKQLTSYFEFLLQQLGNDSIDIITPKNPDEHGCQLSIQVKNADKSLHNKLSKTGVISDWREPNIIRCAPTKMYILKSR